MKKYNFGGTIWSVMFLGFCTISYGQKSFAALTVSSDSLYGYSSAKPLTLKKGSQLKSIQYAENFLSGLRTNNDQTLQLISRSSIPNPNHKQPFIELNNRFTGAPIRGNLGILDKYVFLTSDTKDTITLFVDIDNKGKLSLPFGLKYVYNQ